MEFVTVNTDPNALAQSDEAPVLGTTSLGTLANWHMVTGPLATLNALWKAYGVSISVQKKTGVEAHNDVMDFIDVRGDLRTGPRPSPTRAPPGPTACPPRASPVGGRESQPMPGGWRHRERSDRRAEEGPGLGATARAGDRRCGRRDHPHHRPERPTRQHLQSQRHRGRAQCDDRGEHRPCGLCLRHQPGAWDLEPGGDAPADLEPNVPRRLASSATTSRPVRSRTKTSSTCPMCRCPRRPRASNWARWWRAPHSGRHRTPCG